MKINRAELKDRIFCSDSILGESELVDFWYHANSCDYEYGHASDPRANKIQKRFIHRFDPELFVKTTVWKKIAAIFVEPVEMIESYINHSDASTVTLPHCDTREDNPTVLICLNQEWNRDWWGYTVFFEGIRSDKIIDTICPAPGRVTIFDGSIWHAALPPGPLALYPRFMLAVKLKYTKE